MFLRRRCPSTFSLLLMAGGALVVIFMLKHLYDNNQKCNRLESYKQFIKELSDYLNNVEQSANKSAASLHLLNTALHQQQHQQHTVTELGNKSETGR